MTKEEIREIEEKATDKNRKEIAFYFKLWLCLKKALADEDKLGCHCNNIVKHLGKCVESNYHYYDVSMNVWAEYFLGWM